MKPDRFITAINCIDGRAQLPVIEWLRQTFHVQYVDMITEPGADKILAEADSNVIASIKDKVKFTIHARGTTVVAVVGHHNCLANPVSRDDHISHINQAVDLVESWNFPARVVGLYVNQFGSIDLIADTEDRLVRRSHS